jgi:hypothetical protein
VTSRFVSNLFVLVAASFLLAARFAFGAPALRWLAFGAGGLVVLVVAGAFLARGRGPAQRGLDVVLALIGGWTVVSSLSFSGSVLLWLALLEAAAMAGLALIGLILHEAVMESAVTRWDPLLAPAAGWGDGVSQRQHAGVAGWER